MNDVFLVIGSVFVFVAAVLHLVFFFFESVLWSRPRVWRRFGVRSQEDADTLRFMAYNQGFYNVFLALGAGTGLVLLGSGASYEGGIAICAFALVSMLLASIVLLTGDAKLWRAALLQGAPALLGIVFLGLTLVVG
jgi:putative membrane protein